MSWWGRGAWSRGSGGWRPLGGPAAGLVSEGPGPRNEFFAKDLRLELGAGFGSLEAARTRRGLRGGGISRCRLLGCTRGMLNWEGILVLVPGSWILFRT